MASLLDVITDPNDVVAEDFSESENLLRGNYINKHALHLFSLVNGMPATIGSVSQIVAANNLVLKNVSLNQVSGTTQINAITTSGWVPGSRATLIFSGSATLKHNTAGGNGTAKVLLSGSTDLVAANNTVLSLIWDGTNWQETARKVA